MNELLSSKELAERIGVSQPTIYHWLKRGLPYVETYSGTRMIRKFKVEDVNKWINEQRKK